MMSRHSVTMCSGSDELDKFGDKTAMLVIVISQSTSPHEEVTEIGYKICLYKECYAMREQMWT